MSRRQLFLNSSIDEVTLVCVAFFRGQVSVNTTLTDLNEYLTHLMTSTNMRCLTPEKVGSDPID